MVVIDSRQSNQLTVSLDRLEFIKKNYTNKIQFNTRYNYFKMVINPKPKLTFNTPSCQQLV